MPRYTYRCKACQHVFDVVHGMGTSLTECGECTGQETLVRVPSLISIKKKANAAQNEKKEPGKRVRAYIEDAREDLKIEKSRLRKLGDKK